jgi:glycosyltransferase involved in cell wall biosynthesis
MNETASDRRRTIKVVVVTPLGLGGRGGIDRLMDELRQILRQPYFSMAHVEFWTSRGQRSQAFTPFYVGGIILRLLRNKIRSNVDVVHINLSQSGSTYRKLVIALFCRLVSLPYVLHLHGSRYRQFWDAAPPALSKAISGMFAGSAAILVLGTVWKEYVTARLPEVGSRVAVLPTATRDFSGPKRLRSGPLHILFSGRHGERKGVLELVAALGRMSGRTDWRATLTGDGDVDRTRERVRELGIEDRVNVPGWISVEAFELLLDGADILALPSHDENLPLSVVEAFARGISVVCTPVGALPDIVEHEGSGLLVQPGDVDGLTEAIGRLLDDRKLRHSLAKRAREIFEERLELTSYAERLVHVWQAAHSARA